MSEVSHVWPKSNQANDLKIFARERMRNEVTQANAVFERKKSFKSLAFSAVLREQKQN